MTIQLASMGAICESALVDIFPAVIRQQIGHIRMYPTRKMSTIKSHVDRHTIVEIRHAVNHAATNRSDFGRKIASRRKTVCGIDQIICSTI